MRSTLVAVLLLIVPVLSNAQTDRRDGNWWDRHTRQEKGDYITGFFDGMDLGKNFSYWDISEKGRDSGCDYQAAKTYSDNARKFFSDVTNVQIVDGLDSFYKDHQNRSIRLKAAVWLVVNAIAGTPQDDLDKMVEYLRKKASSD